MREATAKTQPEENDFLPAAGHLIEDAWMLTEQCVDEKIDALTSRTVLV